MSKTIRPWLWLACVAVGTVSVQAQSLADRARLQGDEVAMVAAAGGVVTQEPPAQKEDEAPPPQGETVVEEIAALFGGRLDLGDGPGGQGLRARVIFPAAFTGPAILPFPAAAPGAYQVIPNCRQFPFWIDRKFEYIQDILDETIFI